MKEKFYNFVQEMIQEHKDRWTKDDKKEAKKKTQQEIRNKNSAKCPMCQTRIVFAEGREGNVTCKSCGWTMDSNYMMP